MVLPIGVRAPDFALSSALGETVKLSEVLQDGPVALVFFPLAFSGVCQGELCELQDRLEMFEDARVRLMTISVDSKFALRAWGQLQGYGFTLLSDRWPLGLVARSYDAFEHERGYAARATVLIGTDGGVRASFQTAPGTPRSLEQYQAALARLNIA